jgi:hypothetical protein
MSARYPHGGNQSFDPSAPFVDVPIDPAMCAGQWSSGGSHSAGNDLDVGAASLDGELFSQGTYMLIINNTLCVADMCAAPNELMNQFGWEQSSHSAFQRSVDGTASNGLTRGYYGQFIFPL